MIWYQVKQPMSFAGKTISDPAEHAIARMVGRKKDLCGVPKARAATTSERGIQMCMDMYVLCAE